jgi:2-methylcitrate dehydratase PrpD
VAKDNAGPTGTVQRPPASISRTLARFACSLEFDALPPVVVDKAKAVTLQALVSALAGWRHAPARRTIELIKREETAAGRGSTILVDGSTVTKAGAGYANSELMHAGGKMDSYRVLTHPSTTVMAAALVAAEAGDRSGRDLITAVVAGYEVQARLASEWIPSTQARGFRSSPVYGIFGAAVTAAKLMGLNEDQMNSAIALCVNLAAGNLEGARSGGQPTVIHAPSATRNALLAVLLAQDGLVGGETTLEGAAGFYHSYAGSNTGELIYGFRGQATTGFGSITSELGRRWEVMDTVFRIYSTNTFNMPLVDVTAALCTRHDIRPADVERVEVMMNWLETLYPSPAFPSRSAPTTPGSSQYFCAYGIIARAYPVARGEVMSATADPADPPGVLELMRRVTIVPSKDQHLLAPTITIIMRNGERHTATATGREFMFDLDEEARRIRPLGPELPLSAERFDELIETVRQLDREVAASRLIELTITSAPDRAAAG